MDRHREQSQRSPRIESNGVLKSRPYAPHGTTGTKSNKSMAVIMWPGHFVLVYVSNELAFTLDSDIIFKVINVPMNYWLVDWIAK